MIINHSSWDAYLFITYLAAVDARIGSIPQKIVYKNNCRPDIEIKTTPCVRVLFDMLPWIDFLSSVIKITLCRLCWRTGRTDNDAVSIVLIT